eukprot:s662_g26.t1
MSSPTLAMQGPAPVSVRWVPRPVEAYRAYRAGQADPASPLQGRCYVALAASVFVAMKSHSARPSAPSQILARVLRRARRKKREETEFDPIVEYRRVQEDPIGALSFLEDGEFATRVLACSAAAFLPALLLTTIVFPPADEDGIIFQNMIASFFYAIALAFFFTFLLLLRIGGLLDPLNKNLLAKSYIVEDSRDQKSQRNFGPGDGGYYSEVRVKPEDERQRDKLLGEYTTAPAMARLRKYLLGSIALLALGWTGGALSGAEMRQDLEREEEEGACGSGCIPGFDVDDATLVKRSSWIFNR